MKEKPKSIFKEVESVFDNIKDEDEEDYGEDEEVGRGFPFFSILKLIFFLGLLGSGLYFLMNTGGPVATTTQGNESIAASLALSQTIVGIMPLIMIIAITFVVLGVVFSAFGRLRI